MYIRVDFISFCETHVSLYSVSLKIKLHIILVSRSLSKVHTAGT